MTDNQMDVHMDEQMNIQMEEQMNILMDEQMNIRMDEQLERTDKISYRKAQLLNNFRSHNV